MRMGTNEWPIRNSSVPEHLEAAPFGAGAPKDKPENSAPALAMAGMAAALLPFLLNVYAWASSADRAILALWRNRRGRHGHRSLRPPERSRRLLTHSRHQAPTPAIRERPGIRRDVSR